ncbi:NEUR [Balamuthia mandrillaris]
MPSSCSSFFSSSSSFLLLLLLLLFFFFFFFSSSPSSCSSSFFNFILLLVTSFFFVLLLVLLRSSSCSSSFFVLLLLFSSFFLLFTLLGSSHFLLVRRGGGTAVQRLIDPDELIQQVRAGAHAHQVARRIGHRQPAHVADPHELGGVDDAGRVLHRDHARLHDVPDVHLFQALQHLPLGLGENGGASGQAHVTLAHDAHQLLAILLREGEREREEVSF